MGRPYDGELPGKTKTLFWFPGAKRTGIEKIVPHFPTDRRLVSPFFGRGDCEFAFAARTGQEVVGYDLDDALIAFWQSAFRYPTELAGLIEREVGETPDWPSQEAFRDWWRGKRREMEETPSLTLKGALFLYTQRGSFNGFPEPGSLHSRGRTARADYRLKNIDASVFRTLRFPPSVAVPQVGDCWDTIPRHRDDFLFLDPPYVEVEYFHKTAVGGFDHERLRDLLLFHRGGFLMTNKANPRVLDLYRHFRIEEIERNQAAMGGKSRQHNRELLIFGDAR